MTRSTILTLRRCGLPLLLIGSILSSLVVGTAWAELRGPVPEDRQITFAVKLLLKRGHLSRRSLDDEISERCLKSFLKTLDPMKLYFSQDDIDSFMTKEHELDDMARNGDVSFGYDVFNIFLKRVDDRVALANEFLNTDLDFTVDEEMIVEPDAATYPRNEAEARDRWRQRVKYDLLVQMADDKTLEEAREKLSRRYNSFAKRMRQTDRYELLEMYLTAMTTGYDPHTTYMSPETFENFMIHMKLELEGIGAALQYEDGYTIVSKVIPGGAADKEGSLQEGDRIIGVAQDEDGEMVDVVDMKLSDTVALIRGKRGTTVRLQVIPDGQTKSEIYTIVRARIELKDSEAHSRIFEVEQGPNERPLKLGVIDLPSFYMDMDGAKLGKRDYKSTTRDVEKIIHHFREEGVDAVVMDLRKNGGGSLNESIELTGLFIDEGPVVQVKDFQGNVHQYDDVERGTAWDGPLVVLVSKFSASASEIFAGAIQDYGRGVIIGDKSTHGKGTVQTLRKVGSDFLLGPNAPELGALKITMQKFYRPNGESTQRRGVLSDIELPSFTTYMDVGESDLDYPMEFDEVPSSSFKRAGYVDTRLVEQLNHLSQERRKASSDFQELNEKIARYQERKNRKSVTLNREKFMAEVAELNAEKEEKEQFEDQLNPDSDTIQKSFYLDEALAITADYMRMLSTAHAN